MSTEKKAHIKYVRITPKKLRIILDDIRGKRVLEILERLAITPKHAAYFLKNAIKSCLAQIESKFHGETRIKSIVAQEGPRFKRFQPGGRGAAHPYRKKTAHIEVVLSYGE